jgi:hypothetical protein
LLAILAPGSVSWWAFHAAPASAQVEDADNDGLADAGDPCPADPRNLCYGTVAVDQTTGRAIRINAGAKSNVACSGARVDCTGQVWNKDFGFSAVPRTGVCNLDGLGVACVIGGIEEIFGCDSESTQDLFRCEHFDRTTGSELSYSFAVPNGEYLVNLLFANTFLGTVDAGSRQFGITLEGTPVYESFDQVAAAGGSAIAVVRSAIVTVADGSLDVGFVHELENPTVKAIEVLRRISCVNDVDCADGDLCNGAETCVDLHCVGGQAVMCDPEEVCEAPTGTCRARGGPCTGDGDCIGGEVCNTAKNVCQPLAGPCTSDTDCAHAEVCNLASNSCQEVSGPCEDDLDCAGGELCNLTTQLCGTCSSACANPFEPDSSATTAADALFALRTAVGLQTCALCVCDIGGDGQITAPDALAILRYALALPVELSCPDA